MPNSSVNGVMEHFPFGSFAGNLRVESSINQKGRVDVGWKLRWLSSSGDARDRGPVWWDRVVCGSIALECFAHSKTGSAATIQASLYQIPTEKFRFTACQTSAINLPKLLLLKKYLLEMKVVSRRETIPHLFWILAINSLWSRPAVSSSLIKFHQNGIFLSIEARIHRVCEDAT